MIEILFDSQNLAAKKYIQQIKQSGEFSKSSNLQHYVDEVESFLTAVDALQNSFSQLKGILSAMQSLIRKASQYNKPTYANVRNVTTVSKLRVAKFNQGNVSENITISSNAMQEIELKLVRYI